MLPRSSDLPAQLSTHRSPGGHETGTDPQPSAHRDTAGRFAPGNKIAVDRGMRQTIKAMLGAGAESDEARSVAADAMRTYHRTMGDMPARSAAVETLVAAMARHAALNAYWTARACAVGIGTEEGVAATREALAHGQRMERLVVTAIDVSTRLAKREPAPIDLDAIVARAEAETEERRVRERAERDGGR